MNRFFPLLRAAQFSGIVRSLSRKSVVFEKGTVPDLETFMARTRSTVVHETESGLSPHYTNSSFSGSGQQVFMEIFGCQMNVSDGEVVRSILLENDYTFCNDVSKADIALVMTCSIREGAEQKIWRRLKEFQYLRRKRHLSGVRKSLKVGVLGCMAERLKEKLLEKEKSVDIVCGPDAYRDLPRLLAVTESGHSAVNVLLSLEETYADVTPVRADINSPSAFVSIQRGCDNMCSFCVVPFTRGRERSRSIESILSEIQHLISQGVKDITLLGQNVNSYFDTSREEEDTKSNQLRKMPPGFTTVYKRPNISGRNFAVLLERAAQLDSEVRIRFTSPHPKDFTDDVLVVMQQYLNICKHIHLPAQSGNSQVLRAMRRGYTREAYLALVDRIRLLMPNVSLSSDFIAGFCGETEEQHKDTVDLIQRVKYNFAYCFPYSLRQKTHAYHRLTDDIPEDVKSKRHMELCEAFRNTAYELNTSQIGQHQLVLVEGDSRRSGEDLVGRNDGNTKVIFPKKSLPNRTLKEGGSAKTFEPKPGDYVVVKITDASSQTFKGDSQFLSSIADFAISNQAQFLKSNEQETFENVVEI